MRFQIHTVALRLQVADGLVLVRTKNIHRDTIALGGHADVNAVVLLVIGEPYTGSRVRDADLPFRSLAVRRNHNLLIVNRHAHIRERVRHLVHILADRALRHTGTGRLLHHHRGTGLDASARIRALVAEEHTAILAGEHRNRLRVQALGLQRLGHILGLDHRCLLAVLIGDAGGDGRRIRQRLTTPHLGTIRQE